MMETNVPSQPVYTPIYDQKTLDKVVSKARQKGVGKVEIIVMKYAQTFFLNKNKIVYHHNILLKAGDKKASLCDLTSHDPKENEPVAFNEAAQAAKQAESWRVNAIWYKKHVPYSWFFGEPILD